MPIFDRMFNGYKLPTPGITAIWTIRQENAPFYFPQTPCSPKIKRTGQRIKGKKQENEKGEKHSSTRSTSNARPSPNLQFEPEPGSEPCLSKKRWSPEKISAANMLQDMCALSFSRMPLYTPPKTE